MNIIGVNGNIPWNYFQEPEAQRWIAECPALGIVLEAETYSEMTEMISTSTDMLFRDLSEHGELREFLREHHWKLHGELPANPQEAHFDVPFELVAQRRQHGSSRKAR